MLSIDPVSEVRRVYFLELHGHEQTGLRNADCLQLIVEEDLFGEIEVEVVDGKVKGRPEEIEAVVYFEYVPDQVAPHFGCDQMSMGDVASVYLAGVLAL